MIYDKNFIIDRCINADINDAEILLGNPSMYDDCLDNACEDGSYIKKRCFNEDEDGKRLILYYNSEDNLVYDFKIAS